MPTADPFLEAVEQHRSGNLAQAASMYRDLIQQDPNHADAWCYLGAICQSQGNLAEAESYFRQALQLVPTYPSARNHLGITLAQQGRLDESVAMFEQLVADWPNDAEAHNNLGLVRAQQGRVADAAAHYRKAIELRPDFDAARANLQQAEQHLAQVARQQAAPAAEMSARARADAANNEGLLLARSGQLNEAAKRFQTALAIDPNHADSRNNLGSILLLAGRVDEAIGIYQAALQISPQHADLHANLGGALLQKGQLEQAVAHCQEALRLKPEHVTAMTNLGNALRTLGDEAQANHCYREAARLGPQDPEARSNLGNVLLREGRLDEAAGEYREALRLRPNLPEAHNNLGNVYRDQMQATAAVECYRRAIALSPSAPIFHSNLVYTLNLLPNQDPQQVFDEHKAWARQHAEPLTAAAKPPETDRDAKRRLRVGYVSPYFREHAVNFFSEPILAAHEHKTFEIFCYSDVVRSDVVTERLRSQADVWRDTARLSDEQLAERIREDKIDILVDLSGHIAHNRLLAFARRPAPIQVTYLGYQNTTGMTAMNYRLTDAYADPPGKTDAFYTEKLVRLPGSFFCYRPSDNSPEVNELPASKQERLTFGEFNNPAKVTPEMLAVWCELLKAVPDSRLLVLVADVTGSNAHVRKLLDNAGLDASRVELVPRRPRQDYLRLYNEIDIALDTFPFNGHTTTCDALWMGVPVVSLSGSTYASRFGGSVLESVGLGKLVVTEAKQYIATAKRLASERPRLAKLRQELRGRFQKSPLMDGTKFTRNLEQAYRAMWTAFCTPASAKPVPRQPAPAAKAAPAKVEAAKPVVKPGPAKPAAVKPEAEKPSVAKPPAKPAAAKPEPAKSEAAKPAPAKPVIKPAAAKAPPAKTPPKRKS